MDTVDPMDEEIRRAIIDEGFDPDDPAVTDAMEIMRMTLAEYGRTERGEQ
jgi:hypothetical protein